MYGVMAGQKQTNEQRSSQPPRHERGRAVTNPEEKDMKKKKRRGFTQKIIGYIQRGLSPKSGLLIARNASDVATKVQIAAMREKWKNTLTGSNDIEISPELSNDAHVIAYAFTLDNNAAELNNGMDKSNRTRLWVREGTQSDSADMTTQFRKLKILSKAFGTKGTLMYKNPQILSHIVAGVDFMTRQGQYDGIKYFGNWWDFQIGVPQEFISILMILHDYLDREKIDKYVKIMSKYLPAPDRQLKTLGNTQRRYDLDFLNVKNSWANRVSQAISVLGLGVLIEDPGKIDAAVVSVDVIFKKVNFGDGFYEDGSFVFHECVPYAGEYGKHIVKGMADIFLIISHTQWQIKNHKVTAFVKTVREAFVPLVVNGKTMSMVNGRITTRAPVNEGNGSENMYNLLRISKFGDEIDKRKLRQAAKYWMARNPRYYYNNARDFKDLVSTMAVMGDMSVDTDTKPFLGSRMYGAMDRFVYSDENVTVGISLHSDRISAFAAGNKENKKGWHTSDGMLYLYNSDSQFSSAYWATVDWYRLPGTTVDTAPLLEELSAFSCFNSREKHVGGATDGKDAVVSMQLNKSGLTNNYKYLNMDLKAKKSWFVFDGKIISLGTDISGNTRHTIETVIENRLLNPTSEYTFVDQTGRDVRNGEQQAKAHDWFLLGSSKENESIGYVMLDNQTVATKRESRSGTHRDINGEFPSDIVHRGTYQMIIVKHGGLGKVMGGKYAYLTYPNATPEKLNAVTEGSYTILSNTDEVQAVRVRGKEVDLIGATVWCERGATIEGVKVNRPSIILYRDGKDTVSISISNLKHTGGLIKVRLPYAVTGVIYKDVTVGVVISRGVILVHTKGALGRTFSVTLSK